MKQMSNRIQNTQPFKISQTQEDGRVYKPQLLWPKFIPSGDGFLEDDDTVFCRNRDEVKAQRKFFNKIKNEQGISMGSRLFWESFRLSKDILLVDRFFCTESYQRMLIELRDIFHARDGNKKNILIFCEKDYNEISKLRNNPQKEDMKLFSIFSVEIKRLEMHYTSHDRFAIMDHEIWHCGAAVGGMHGELSALSRGWRDENDCLRKYFCGGHGEYVT